MECKIYFAIDWSAKFILRFFYVPNLFCVFLRSKFILRLFTFQIDFAFDWSTKFILRLIFVPCYFAITLFLGMRPLELEIRIKRL